jgi:hypothetical protein
MSGPPPAPPPGDPASSGPRPPAGWRDWVWLAVAIALILVTLLQAVRLVVIVFTEELTVSPVGLLLAFAITVVWLVGISWLVAGGWRRSVWGCPFDHTQDTPAARRCPRHRLVAGDP